MIVNKRIQFQTQGNGQIIDITDQISRNLQDSGLSNGIVTLFTPSSTSGLTTTEYESGAVQDLQQLFDRIASPALNYRHNQRWGDGNGHAHARHALLGPSLTIPFIEGQMTLGTWQQIIFMDFDNRPRSRTLVIQIMGD
jgi:secondary thiamine-phosphate synthase enzyme